ncbi:hypothetical protein AB0L53_08825 [Nonomuraea sp. NPDC052129]|uniref:hypothetical protein n=1 Tax=Nonomuraea sp. NPDC052129 TaxID=3154651 RepID=UPI0034291993
MRDDESAQAAGLSETGEWDGESGRAREALSTLLTVVAESDRAGGYVRAISYYAENLDETV